MINQLLKTDIGNYLKSIINTKEKIRQSIIKKGGNIDQNTVFQLYPQAIEQIVSGGQYNIKFGQITQFDINHNPVVTYVYFNGSDVIFSQQKSICNLYTFKSINIVLDINNENDLNAEYIGTFELQNINAYQNDRIYKNGQYIIKYNLNMFRWELLRDNTVIDYTTQTYSTPQDSSWVKIKIQKIQ